MADVCFERGYFATTDGNQARANIHASQLMTSISAKLMFTEIGSSILLLQAGSLVAPIFVVQDAPFGYHPWWNISVVQYHSIDPSIDSCKVNVWSMFSLENQANNDIREQDLYVYPSSTNLAGLITVDQEIRFRFRPAHMASMLRSNYAENYHSLVRNERIRWEEHKQELEELTGKERHGLLPPGSVREDYTTIKIGTLVNRIAAKYTLETEVKKLLGVTNED